MPAASAGATRSDADVCGEEFEAALSSGRQVADRLIALP
jgi:hypothetical protein